jgi:hypothetical protein
VGIALALIAALVVVVIAFYALGRVTGELSARPTQTVFDMDEAVDFVADRLPYEVSARLSHDDVRRILHWHLDYLEHEGVASESVPEVLASGNGDGPPVIEDDASVAFVIGEATRADLEVSDVDVLLVIEAATEYFRAIGAIGGMAPEPEDPG